MSTNILINSRSMNGIITISDGTATLENGDLNCDDIISSTLTSGIFTCRGEFRSNTTGPYTIPTLVSSEYGTLISYGNSSGNGATDFTNFQSTYNITKGGFNFWNKSSTVPLTNLAIIDNSQTYFKSQLIGCTAENPVNNTSIVNKSYVDDNFVDRTNTLTQNINGLKTFTNNLTCSASLLSDNLTAINLTSNKNIYTTMTAGTINLGSSSNTINCAGTINGTIVQSSNFRGGSSTASVQICGNAQNADITLAPALGVSGTLTIGSANATNTIRGISNFTGSLRTKTNFKMNEIDDYTGNTINLTFPMAQLTILRISSGTSMTLNLPQLTANERGMIFYFLKTNNTTNCTVNAYTGQNIVEATNISTPVSSSTNILSADKVMMKLYIGYYQTLTFWVELTEFSTYDRLKLREWTNPTATNSLTLTLQMMSPTIAVRISSGTSMIVTLPALNANERGKIFTFVKANATNFSVQFNTTGTDQIFALNNISTGFTTNTSIFPIDKRTCRLAVGFSGTTTYWIEIGDYSTFDRDENNLLYPRLAIENTFTNNNIFNGQATFNNFTPISNVANPTANNHLVRKDYVDNNFVNLSTAQNIYGSKYFGSRVQLYGGIALDVGPGTSTFAGVVTFSNNITCSASLISNNITSPVVLGGTNNIFTNLDTFTGGAIINIGARSNNINILCNLNIVESVYGVTPNKITTINQEGDSCRFTNNGSTNGDFIFQINESGSFVPLVINKTSVDIGGDAVVGGNLYLNDTTPLSTLSMSVGVIGNDMTFDPENTTNTTYKFKVTDGSSPAPVTSTALTISSALTTINTPTTITELLTCKNLDLSFTGTASINCPNATGLNLFLALTTGTIGLFSNLTSAIVNFCSSSVFTTIFNINSRIKHKQFQYLNEVRTVSSTSVTLSLPLEQTIMLTSTGATGINITLPALTLSTQAGFTFNVIKTGSITNTVTFTASGSNLIRTYGSITGTSTASALGGIETIINLFTLEVSAGNFVWQIY